MAKRFAGTRATAMRDALSAWSAERDETTRTALIADLLDEPSIATSWIIEVARHGVDDERLVDTIADRVARAARHERHGAYIDALLAVAPDGRSAHIKVARIVLALLERDTKVDFDLALRAAPALGTDHQHGEKLRQAFDRATQQNSFSIPAKSLSDLHRAGVQPKQRSAAETARDLWSNLWGGRRRG